MFEEIVWRTAKDEASTKDKLLNVVISCCIQGLFSAQSMRLSIDSGMEVNWLDERSNSCKLVSWPIDSGMEVNWLVPRPNSRKLVSRPTDSGMEVNWLE